MSRDTDSRSFNRRVGRRELLAMGVASGAAALLPSVARAKPGTTAGSAGVGYVLGSESRPSLASGPAGLGFEEIVIVPAASVAPDSSLAGASLDIKTFGLFPGLPATGVSSATLNAMFASFAKRDRGPFPFTAGTFAAGNAQRGSCKSSFTMPVDAQGTVTFSVTVADAMGTRSRLVSLSLDPRAATRLRAGVYLLGLNGTEFAGETLLNPSGPANWSLLSFVMSVRPSGA